MRLESDCLENHHLEPFILPPLCLHMPSPWLQHRQCRGRVSLGQLYPGLAEMETVSLREMSGCRQIALVKQRQHLRGDNLRHPMDEVLLVHGPIRLSKQSGRAGRIALCQFQAGEKYVSG